MTLLLSLLALIGGLALLIYCAHVFIDNSAALARILSVPSLIIGIIVVGFGTSAPEIFVSIVSSWRGLPGIAYGNALGSNIANIGLILGLTLLIYPMALDARIVRVELPFLLGATLLLLALLVDLNLSRIDALILFLAFAALLSWQLRSYARGKNGSDVASTQSLEEESAESFQKASWQKALLLVVVGLAGLLLSSQVFVWGAENLARLVGVSELVIGLTIVAVGTSLPELASSIVAARKREADLVLGNIIGSNLFNGLLVIAISAAIAPSDVARELFYRDMLWVLVITLVMFVACLLRKKQGKLGKIEGIIFLAFYIAYTGYLAYVTLQQAAIR